MSELQWNWVYRPYLDAPEKQKESAQGAGYTKVVFKSEADMVIAHNKYKRCLLMSKICENKLGTVVKPAWWNRWRRRWLELAEKFKEAHNEYRKNDRNHQ